MPITIKQARVGAKGGKGLTQQECADLLGVHVNTYRRWEERADVMPIGYAKRFAEIVGVSFDALSFCPESRI